MVIRHWVIVDLHLESRTIVKCHNVTLRARSGPDSELDQPDGVSVLMSSGSETASQVKIPERKNLVQFLDMQPRSVAKKSHAV